MGVFTKTLPEIIAVDPASARVKQIVNQVAPTDSSIMIRGESGTGKSLWAKWIHLISSRADAPLVAIDCASMPLGLLESDLFGYEKGAFTDAVSAKPGRLELADKGTVIFENIAEMPSALQAKLLRVIEERAVERLGSAKKHNIDVRFISCAPSYIEKLVAAGTFRKDFYYRLNVVPVEIPPLRERKHDIVPLAEIFLKKFSAVAKKNITSIDEPLREWLEIYRWPGNVRELENAFERAVILADKENLSLKHFPFLVDISEDRAIRDMAFAELSLDKMKELYTEQILAKTNGNISEAARILGVSRKTLYAKLEKMRKKSPV